MANPTKQANHECVYHKCLSVVDDQLKGVHELYYMLVPLVHVAM